MTGLDKQRFSHSNQQFPTKLTARTSEKRCYPSGRRIINGFGTLLPEFGGCSYIPTLWLLEKSDTRSTSVKLTHDTSRNLTGAVSLGVGQRRGMAMRISDIGCMGSMLDFASGCSLKQGTGLFSRKTWTSSIQSTTRLSPRNSLNTFSRRSSPNATANSSRLRFCEMIAGNTIKSNLSAGTNKQIPWIC